VPPTIDQLIAAIPDWAGRTVVADRIAAGLTNTNYRVEVDGLAYFVRIPGAATELLAVDRTNELYNTRAAAVAGVSPRVVHSLPEWEAFVLDWVPGRTMSNEAFTEADSTTRIAGALRRLHAGPRFRGDFDMFRLVERYLEVVDARDIRIPVGYREHQDILPRIEAALRAHPLATVPCHNDLLADNYIDDGEQLWIVDFEYSGNGDPSFELGNTAQELGFGERQLIGLCEAYFGEATPRLLARLRLQMVMSDVGWTLWAAIQARISTIEFDFAGWAEERSVRAGTMIEGPDFEAWLHAAER
jgi:thiamine kinase-like enzyme